jgi:hypothetical protein
MLAMKRRLRFALVLPLAALIGCTLPTTITSPSNPTPSGAWTNWQIQAGTAITSPPNTYPSFVGALQIQGTQASGVFNTVYAPGVPTPSTTVEDYSGTFTPATGVVLMATSGFGFNYTEPASPFTLTPVGVTGGCVYPPGYTGPECLAIFSSPSVGVEIAPLNGTYSGILTSSSTPAIIGTGTVTFTQASTPSADGSFPLTAAVTFPSGSIIGTYTYPLTGTVSGEGLSGSYVSTAVIGPIVSLTASTNPTATKIAVSNLTWAQTGPSFTFTGTLTLQ